MQPSDYACIAGAVAIATYDAFAKPGETISEAVDRYLIAHRWATEVVLIVVYLHLANRLPAQLDPIHWLIKAFRRV